MKLACGSEMHEKMNSCHSPCRSIEGKNGIMLLSDKPNVKMSPGVSSQLNFLQRLWWPLCSVCYGGSQQTKQAVGTKSEEASRPSMAGGKSPCE